jgi:hypothetical protein
MSDGVMEKHRGVGGDPEAFFIMKLLTGRLSTLWNRQHQTAQALAFHHHEGAQRRKH